MSEYQYVAFRAIDGPVSEKNLDYMRRQSSRAEITPRSFDNEYHYGDFHGDALGMLRRGYDIHLHYANFGVRSLLIRLPDGFRDSAAAKPYLRDESIRFLKDKRGPGGTLAIRPCYEPGDLDELWDLGDVLDRLAPLRAEILNGDLRPLYLACLAVACDGDHDPEERTDAPVPAGLRDPTNAQLALAELYGIGKALIAAAARESAPTPASGDRRSQYADWLAGQPQATKDAWLSDLLDDPHSPVRSEILSTFRRASQDPPWPTAPSNRTLAQLLAEAERLQCEAKKKAAAKAARRRARKLKKMAADPTPYLRETESLVAQRSTDTYRQASKLLADLREALADSKQRDLAQKQAMKLKAKNPKRYHLIAALRREGFLPK